ncbi:hypothetical protein AMS68_007796 [Peltaster fructicola]|uniref:Alpha/beta hydrolase fold-3 domain-containing protein n=1 Tax=Peltaster fructicola TaxID=286661 RepID=A0A6H0Y618_9PEZI|nr:hypothetical protein AMS68_007796 [Peltaster fructicola]
MKNHTLCKPPGRLGDGSMTIVTDPRTHPRLVAFIKEQKLGDPGFFDLPELTREHTRPIVAAFHKDIMSLYAKIGAQLPWTTPEVLQSTETCRAVDGTEIKLHIFRRANLLEKAPAVLYMHGGAMVAFDTANAIDMQWCNSLAASDILAIAIDFRNAYTEHKDNPYPVGLNDCAAALKHVFLSKERLGVSKIVLEGESGGGNLAIATAMKAQREGYVDHIDGVYAIAPYLSNAYHWPEERKLEELPSLVECDGYLMSMQMLTVLGWYYTSDDDKNPHAWPYHAPVEELRGLPPHVIVVEELDPLRDEGMAFYRKLLMAGVKVVGKMELGVVHNASGMFCQTLPEIHKAAIDDVVAFARSL